MQHKYIIEKIKTMAKEKEQKAILAKKEKEQKETKVHLETRIGNFLKANAEMRFTEQELKAKVAVNTRDLINFHSILIALVSYQRRSGYYIEADHTDPKKPIFYYGYKKTNQKNLPL
jgi:hypothetical protein